MDRMHSFGPTFIDITWGAGGRLANLTTEMVNVSQSALGLNTCMHLTCTDMAKSKIDEALEEAYNAGCTNILALRGDPPREKEKWEATAGGFRYAKDLVKYIREKYNNHFDIGVAGYSEGCDDNQDPEQLMEHLKEKVDAGATFVVTQMFYDVDIFINWMEKCRAKGITVPIIPGIMPIHTYAAFIRRAQWQKIRIPDKWMEILDPVKNDDSEVREIGKQLLIEMCQKLLAAGVSHFHFYTMNLANATRMILEGLDILPDVESPISKPLPWRQSLGLKRREENVRPIFWRNRNRSYVARTSDWDEFPNGRWGDARSPAFGELDAYGIGLKGSNEHYRKLWGEPQSIQDVASMFVKYMQGDLESLPWSEQRITSEADVIKDDLVKLNQRGLLTINSQPAVNGVRATDAVYGWGPRNGYVYQKAYIEVLVSPELISELITRIDRNPELTYYCINKAGELSTNAPSDGPNAVTWGVFPGKEIVQPTIVERVSFMAWKDEFYRLGQDWAECHPASSPTRYLIEDLMDTWYLVNIGKCDNPSAYYIPSYDILVHNDFHQTHGIFPVFDGMEVNDIAKPLHVIKDVPVLTTHIEVDETPHTNGVTA
jgi:methylenetetrahydrofolate reductase (NADPH)